MEKNRILIVGLIGLLMAVGLFLAGCGVSCPGSGECTATINQGASGLYIDYDFPRSTCGGGRSWDSNTSSGCIVENNINYYSDRTYGTKSCNCSNLF